MATVTLDLEIDEQGIAEGLESQFLDANLLAGREFQKAIASNIWGWTDGELRDIIDSGDLLQSYKPKPLSATEYEHTWTVDYAAAVLLGAVFQSREGSLPARNWILYVLRTFDFPEEMAKLGEP